MLLFTLYSIDYYYDANQPIDGCRGEDGLDIRREYFKISGSSDEQKALELRSCTVLEWLLGMAIRCENQIMFNEAEGDRTALWFWSMIDNMGFSGFTDIYWNDRARTIVHSTLDDIMLRDFPCDGSGTPFPLCDTSEDVRECDWWKALNLWLSENFGDEFEF